MHEKHLYEYAVIRVVPKVEREEFLNVGVVAFCKNQKFLGFKFHLDRTKLQVVAPELDLEQLEMNLRSFEKICRGDQDGGPIALLDLPSRFRWLTAVRSSVIQTSRPHPGLCDNMEKTLDRLFQELVL